MNILTRESIATSKLERYLNHSSAALPRRCATYNIVYILNCSVLHAAESLYYDSLQSRFQPFHLLRLVPV